MKITRLTTCRLSSRWTFLEVEADKGVTGWGGLIIEGRARTVEVAVHELSYHLIGQDPSRTNDLWQAMYRVGLYRGGPILVSVVAGIDQALWDIKGKVLGVPVYEPLGGPVRDKMRTYSWVGGDRPADAIVGMKVLQAVGFGHFKLNGCEEMGIIDTSHAVDAAVAKAVEIRSASGNTAEPGLGFHGRVSAPMVKVLIKELEPYRPLFTEEPALAEQVETYARPAAHTHLPIAAGERMFLRFDFKRALEVGGASVLQPDLSHAGGITEYVKITAMVEAYDVALAPYCPLSSIAPAVCLHADFVSWNVTLQEQSMGIHHNKGAELLDYARNKADSVLEDGYTRSPCLPSLGVDIGEVLVIERNKEVPDWRNPVWHHADGFMAEW